MICNHVAHFELWVFLMSKFDCFCICNQLMVKCLKPLLRVVLYIREISVMPI